MSTSVDIIDKILQHEQVKAAGFAKIVGVTPTQIYDLQSGKIKKISSSIANKIHCAYPHYNLSWLLTGEGEMLKQFKVDEVEIPTDDEVREIERLVRENKAVWVPLINIDSVGGVHSENLITTSEQYVERMIPLPDARPGDVAIMQSGNSMAPTIPAGAFLHIRKVEGWREYFGYGNDYVLWLTDGRRITKRVLKYSPDPKNYVICHSYNPEVEDEELPRAMIQEVWKVVNVLINKGW